VKLFVFDRGEPAQGTVATTPVVENLQVLKDRSGELDAGGPLLTVEEFDLHPGPEGLNHGVVVGVTDGAIEGSRPASLARWVNAHEVYCEP